MYIILFITHYRYHSLIHLRTTVIEIQVIKIIKRMKPGEKIDTNADQILFKRLGINQAPLA